jgi:hypothetical protein
MFLGYSRYLRDLWNPKCHIYQIVRHRSQATLRHIYQTTRRQFQTAWTDIFQSIWSYNYLAV